MCTSCNGSELFYSGKQGVLRSFTLLASWFGGGLAWFLLLLFVFLLLLFPEVFPSHLPAPGAESGRGMAAAGE